METGEPPFYQKWLSFAALNGIETQNSGRTPLKIVNIITNGLPTNLHLSHTLACRCCD